MAGKRKPAVSKEAQDVLVAAIRSMRSRPLSGDTQRMDRALGLLKSVSESRGGSLQERTPGGIGMLVSPPFDLMDAKQLKLYNEHHATCVRIKRRALVGQGLKERSFQRQLNKLCRFGTRRTFGALMDTIASDYVDTFNGYMEVVREAPKGKILGLHWLPAEQPSIIVEDETGIISYEVKAGVMPIRNTDGLPGVRVMAEFGRTEQLQKIRPERVTVTPDGRCAEIIHFKAGGNLSNYYGVPDWLAVVATCELVAAVRQHVFDFFNNRGVPALLMLLQGGHVGTELWEAMKAELQDNVGGGNAFRTSAFHLPDTETKATFQQLSPQNTENGTFFRDMNEALSTVIMSAHGVHPNLGGVTIPGKMGSVNDLPNALIAFQTIEAGPVQRTLEEQLWETLGDPELNGGLDVPAAAEDSDGPFAYNSILEEMAAAMKLLAPAQTMGQSRQNLAEQASEGRDPADGLKD